MDARLAAWTPIAAGSTMEEPTWARVHYPKIDFQELLLLCGAEEHGGAEEPR